MTDKELTTPSHGITFKEILLVILATSIPFIFDEFDIITREQMTSIENFIVIFALIGIIYLLIKFIKLWRID